MPDKRAAAIVVAAGQGRRMGGISKALLLVNGKPIINYVLDAIQTAALVSEIILVGNPAITLELQALAESGAWPKLTRVVTGGDRRQDSVMAGLDACGAGSDVIVVHDVARPFAAPALFDACIAAAREHGAAITAVPVVDTLKRVRDDVIDSTVDRSGLWGAQTPQAVRTDLLMDALGRGIDVTDEAMLMESIGQSVRIVEGSRFNIKITHAADLAIATAFARALTEPS